MPKSKKPWELYPHIWPTEAKYIAFIRGGIRKAIWNRYPIKLEYIKNNRRRIKNPNPRGKVAEVWGGTCGLCGNDFPQSQLQVDHVVGNHRFTGMEYLQSYMEALLFISEDDLSFVCKPCHKIKSYAERMGITFEEARVAKQVIEFKKKDLTQMLKELKLLGLKPEKQTKKAFGEVYEKYLKQEK